MLAGTVLTGCAASPSKRLAFVQPGVTTQEDVLNRMGKPRSLAPREGGGQTLTYVERKHRVLKTTYMGGMMGFTYSGVLALASAPFTLGAGFLAVPLCTVVGLAVGAVAGLVIKMDGATMQVDLGPDGTVVQTRVN